jgi:hypothetical protein
MGGGSPQLNAMLRREWQTLNGHDMPSIYCSLHTVGKYLFI